MNGIQGTFFVLSNKVLENPKLIRTLDEDGHVIGNHTYDHPRCEHPTPQLIREQLDKTEQVVNQVLMDRYPNGYPHRYFRPPCGLPWTRGGTHATRMLQRVLDEKGLLLTLWHVDSRDWKYKKSDDIICHVKRCLNSVQGGILLFHDTSEAVIPVLEKLVVLLKAGNYEVVGLQKLEQQLAS